MKMALKLLQQLQLRFPTPVGIKHNLTFDLVGLRVSIYFKEKWFQFIINGEDLDRPPESLIPEFEEMIWDKVKTS